MAFDALRMRNTIQLLGILSTSYNCYVHIALYLAHSSMSFLVFHIALMTFAALQIHQTKTALVTEPHCSGTDNYVVGFALMSLEGSHP